MGSEGQEYRLQLMLAPEARSPAARDRLKSDLRRLGIELSGEGAATLSGRISDPHFARLFACGPGDFEASGEALPIPDDLKDRVTSITLAPRHLHLE